jgi:lysophospholipase L1-like esterase
MRSFVGLRRRAVLRLVLVVALVGAGAFAAAEIALRLRPELLPEAAQLRLYWDATDNAIPKLPDPHLGFAHGPNQAGQVRYRDFAFAFTTDERGFRNAGPWAPRADVVAVGDSQTFGFGVGDHHGWVAALDRALGEHRAVNLGINGMAPHQQLRVLEAFQDELRPRVVLFGLFPGNAMGAAGEFQAWLDAGRPEPFTVFRRRPDGQPFWKRAVREATNLSRVLLYARSVVDGLRTPYGGSTLEFADGGRIRFAPFFYAGYAERAKPGEPLFEGVIEAVVRAREVAGREGSGFLVVLFPTKEEVYLPLHGRPAPDVTGPFARAFEARGIPYVDLLSAFRERAKQGERLFLEIDIHPNEEGYALVADEVLRHLRAEPGLLAMTDGGTRQPQPVRR